jgi:proline dehydrogenase
MPGEDVGSALDAAEQLRSHGITTTFTRLGENVVRPEEAAGVRDHYLDVLDRIRKRSLDTHISTKLTQLGLDIDPDLAYAGMRTITEKAARLGNFTWIDMEQSGYVDITLDIYRRIRKEFANIGVCLQSYLRRTPKDLESLYSLSPAIRLVKGAYKEPAELVLASKREVDEAYFRLSVEYLAHVERSKHNLSYGTHDLSLIRRIAAAVKESGLEKSAPEYTMLYGIQTQEQLRLAREGYKVRVLVAYGDYWFPWYMRRLAERPANVWFVLKNLVS